jgi:hypothetical protein
MREKSLDKSEGVIAYREEEIDKEGSCTINFEF